jgi:hypothetical protein
LGEITVVDGKIEQENFDTYKMLLLSQMPQTEVHIIESGEKLGGIGEVGTPPIAPALATPSSQQLREGFVRFRCCATAFQWLSDREIREADPGAGGNRLAWLRKRDWREMVR